MLRDLKELSGSKVLAHDGKVGKVCDFLYDESTWHLRYLSVDTGNWFMRRDVLVPPSVIEHAGVATHTLMVALNKEEVRHCPEAEPVPPLAQVSDSETGRHFQWPMYGEGAGMWVASMWTLPESGSAKQRHDPSLTHLRSFQESLTYQIRTVDGELGGIRSLIIDDETWEVRYVVIGTGSLFSRQCALVPAAAIVGRDDNQRIFDVKITSAAVLSSPLYKREIPVTREFEEGLYHHLGLQPYWSPTTFDESDTARLKFEHFFGKRAG